MVVHLNSCCCGCSLKTGTSIIGFLGLIFSIIYMGIMIYIAQLTDDVMDDIVDKSFIPILRNLIIVGSVFCGLEALLCILLLIGVYNNHPGLVMVWIVYRIIGLVIGTVLELVLLFTATANAGNVVGVIIGTILAIYYILVVNSFHTEMKNPRQNQELSNTYQPANSNLV